MTALHGPRNHAERLLLLLELHKILHPDSPPSGLHAACSETTVPTMPRGSSRDLSLHLPRCLESQAALLPPRELQLPQCSEAQLPPPRAPSGATSREYGLGWGRLGAAGLGAVYSGSPNYSADMASQKDQQKDAEVEGLSAT